MPALLTLQVTGTWSIPSPARIYLQRMPLPLPLQKLCMPFLIQMPDIPTTTKVRTSTLILAAASFFDQTLPNETDSTLYPPTSFLNKRFRNIILQICNYCECTIKYYYLCIIVSLYHFYFHSAQPAYHL